MLRPYADSFVDIIMTNGSSFPELNRASNSCRSTSLRPERYDSQRQPVAFKHYKSTLASFLPFFTTPPRKILTIPMKNWGIGKSVHTMMFYFVTNTTFATKNAMRLNIGDSSHITLNNSTSEDSLIDFVPLHSYLVSSSMV